MIRVTVELVSAIHPSRSKVLGIAEISNDGHGTATIASYRARLSKWAPRLRETWAHGIVHDFDRKRRGPWDLIYQALIACGVQTRNPYVCRINSATGEIEELKT